MTRLLDLKFQVLQVVSLRLAPKLLGLVRLEETMRLGSLLIREVCELKELSVVVVVILSLLRSWMLSITKEEQLVTTHLINVSQLLISVEAKVRIH